MHIYIPAQYLHTCSTHMYTCVCTCVCVCMHKHTVFLPRNLSPCLLVDFAVAYGVPSASLQQSGLESSEDKPVTLRNFLLSSPPRLAVSPEYSRALSQPVQQCADLERMVICPFQLLRLFELESDETLQRTTNARSFWLDKSHSRQSSGCVNVWGRCGEAYSVSGREQLAQVKSVGVKQQVPIRKSKHLQQ